MTHFRFSIRVAGLMCLLPLASCGWLSESGPLKRSIGKESDSYTLINVTSQADIPGKGRTYGVGAVPPNIKGQGYSDKIRSRDSLDFIVTDLTEESPFHTKGEPYKFGPVEVPEDGSISIPYVGAIQVINRSLSQVSSDLEAKMKPVSNTARVTVLRSNRMPRTANVIGEVRKPGPIPLERAGITSEDILAAAGGPSDAEHLYKYTLRRGGKDYNFDYLGYRRNPFIVEEGDLLSVSADTDNRFPRDGSDHQALHGGLPRALAHPCGRSGSRHRHGRTPLGCLRGVHFPQGRSGSRLHLRSQGSEIHASGAEVPDRRQ
jgi:protein involved in polysaccharide export with SLBB domain